MVNLKNPPVTSSFTSNKTYTSNSSLSMKDTNMTVDNSAQKRVVVILKNENNKKSKEKNENYRHSMSFPSSSFQTGSLYIHNHSDYQTLTSVPTKPTSNQNADDLKNDGKNSDEITSGVVKNLRKKFLPVDSFTKNPTAFNVISRGRSKSELATNNHQLKKSQSVIIGNLENENISLIDENSKLMGKPGSNGWTNIKSKRSSTFLNELNLDENMNKNAEKSYKFEPKDKINDVVFENVHIKDKISKFSINSHPEEVQMRSNSKLLNLRNPSDNPMKHGGSCKYLCSTTKPSDIIYQTDQNLPVQGQLGQPRNICIKSSISDTDASNDDSSSEDFTSSSENNSKDEKSINNKNNNNNDEIAKNTENGMKKTNIQRFRSELSVEQHQKINERNTDIKFLTTSEEHLNNSHETTLHVHGPTVKRFFSVSNNNNNKKIQMNHSQFDPLKFEQDYKKIKDAFNDLKKDNELIETMLTSIRNRIKETNSSFVDNFSQNTYDPQDQQCIYLHCKNYITDVDTIEPQSTLDSMQTNFRNSIPVGNKLAKDLVKNKFSTQLAPNDAIKMQRHKF